MKNVHYLIVCFCTFVAAFCVRVLGSRFLSEKNLYADIDAAWQALRTRYGISPQNVILYGQSIGTVPTIDLASRYEVGAAVLHSPLMSGMRVAFPETKRTWFFDAFPRLVQLCREMECPKSELQYPGTNSLRYQWRTCAARLLMT